MVAVPAVLSCHAVMTNPVLALMIHTVKAFPKSVTESAVDRVDSRRIPIALVEQQLH